MVSAVGNARRFCETTNAVVVGVSSYEGSGLPDLPACAREASSLAQALVSLRGCGIPEAQVQLILDAQASRDVILATLSSAANATTSDDILIFYFAGHGEDEKDGFVLRTGPGDADPQKGVSQKDLIDVLSSAAARGVLVILDCCGGARIAENAPTYFHSLAGHDFRLLVSASRAGQSSWEVKGKGSLFTSRLLRVLRGDQQLGQAGAIYFGDLFDYLCAGVVEDAEREFGSRDAQTPIFAGSHADDPLLFLNRDVTLAKVRVLVRRITPELHRRRVRVAMGALLASCFAILIGYWAFLDSHQYLEVRGDSIALVHGFPGLSGFALPRDDWIYDYGPDDIADQNVLAGGHRMMFDRSRSAERALLDVTKPAARSSLFLWLNDRDNARAELFKVGTTNKDTRELWEALSKPGDEERLAELTRSSKPGDGSAIALALRRLNVDDAVKALRVAQTADDGGVNLDVLSEWNGSCTPETQRWFDDILRSESGGRIAYLTTLHATVRTKGCAFPLDQIFPAPTEHIRDAVYALRLTNSVGADQLQHMAEGALSEPEAATSTKFSALIGWWRYLAKGPCPSWLDKPPQTVGVDSELDVGVAAARDCKDARLVVEVVASQLEIVLKRPGHVDRKVDSMYLGPELGPGAISSVDAIVEAKADGTAAALTAMISATRDPVLRTYLAQQVRLLKIRVDDPMALALPNQAELDRELFRLLARSESSKASDAFVDLLTRGAMNDVLFSLPAFIPLTEDAKIKIREQARTKNTIERTILLTLVGHPDEVVQLLLDPDPQIRARAAKYVVVRSDAKTLLDTADRASKHASRQLVSARQSLAKLAALYQEVAETPDWARAWYAKWIADSTLLDEGQAVAYERFVDEVDIYQ